MPPPHCSSHLHEQGSEAQLGVIFIAPAIILSRKEWGRYNHPVDWTGADPQEAKGVTGLNWLRSTASSREER